MTPVLACPVCFGATDGALVTGSTLGILTLLAVTVVILSAFGWFFLTLRARAAAAGPTAGQPLPVARVTREEQAC